MYHYLYYYHQQYVQVYVAVLNIFIVVSDLWTLLCMQWSNKQPVRVWVQRP